jgi:uncharacterized protein (TIGR02594 family)
MSFPKGYEWLGGIGQLPRTIVEALALHGTKEVPGPGDNPVILKWAAEVGKDVASVYGDDSIPWCGLFAAVVVKRAGKAVIAGPLWAKNWAKFGTKADKPSLGDVLVFERPGGGGHVGFYVAEDNGAYHVIGGNQSDAVTITRIAKGRCIAARRPVFSAAKPASVKPYEAFITGKLSENEA